MGVPGNEHLVESLALKPVVINTSALFKRTTGDKTGLNKQSNS
jgi:hypothetical protein